jgi:subtilisin family serine protease
VRVHALTRGLTCLCLTAAALPAAASASAKERYIAVYGPAVTRPALATDHLEGRLGFDARLRFRTAVRGFAAALTDHQAAALRRTPGVRAVVADTPVRAAASPLAAGETVPDTTARTGALSGGLVHDASSAAIAVVDSGVDLANADLDAVSGVNCITAGAPASDDNGHGTHVAGIAAARNDGAGVVGIAPGTRVVSVKVLDSRGTGLTSQVICGLDWVVAHAGEQGIRVVNMSLTAPGTTDTVCGGTKDPLHAAVCRTTAAGVTVVAAAGNSTIALRTVRPANYPEVLPVTAIADSDGTPGATGGPPSCRVNESDDAAAVFSNFASAPDAGRVIAAPGTCILSDAPGNRFAVLSGTSMAAPAVAAAAALCLDEGGIPGRCAGQAPAGVAATLRAAAEASATLAGGFRGDPNRPFATTKTYGYLVAPSPAAPLPPCTITGTAAADTLVGTPGDDVICGLGGNDVISGGAGSDLELGGGGNDSFKEDAAPNGADRFVGGPGADLVDYSARSEAVSVTLDDAGDDGAAGEGDNAPSDVEKANGGKAADLITGSLVANTLAGKQGNDTISGAAGDDLITASTGNDVVSGGDGADTFAEESAANGSDQLSGDAGRDTVDYSKRKLALTVTLGNGSTVPGDDGQLNERDALDVEVVRGGTAADVLTGGPGADALFGGLGADRLSTVDGIFGNDTADGGDGVDTCTADAGDAVAACEL